MQNPLYVYNTAGTYTVSLTIDGGVSTETKIDYVVTVVPNISLSAVPVAGCICDNTMIVVKSTDDVEFVMSDPESNEVLHNDLFYAYGGGSVVLHGAPNQASGCIMNRDPGLIGVTDIDETTVPNSEMKPHSTSPVVDNGSQTYATSLPTDIEGNARISVLSNIDIGPYELDIIRIDLSASDIISVDQDSFTLDTVQQRFLANTSIMVYHDLFNAFNDNVERVEFTRESKIIIAVRPPTTEYKFLWDKPLELIAQMDAWFDRSTWTVMAQKDDSCLWDALRIMMNDDRYVYRFDEAVGKIMIFLNPSYEDNLSGMSNVLTNVQSGGSPILNG